jgi:hypothetical protein
MQFIAKSLDGCPNHSFWQILACVFGLCRCPTIFGRHLPFEFYDNSNNIHLSSTNKIQLSSARITSEGTLAKFNVHIHIAIIAVDNAHAAGLFVTAWIIRTTRQADPTFLAMGSAQTTTHGYFAGEHDDRRLQSLADDLECLSAVRQRYPTLDWRDFDGAFLVHSSHNTLRNQLAVLEWNAQAKRDASHDHAAFATASAGAREDGQHALRSPRSLSQVTFAERIQEIPRASSAREPCQNGFSRCNQPLIDHGATDLATERSSAQAAAHQRLAQLSRGMQPR